MRDCRALGLVAAVVGSLCLSLEKSVAQDEGAARFHGEYVWRSGLAGFSEFSGLHMTDGRTFVTVTDIGTLGQGVLARDAAGRISGVRLDGFVSLREEGRVLSGARADAEAVARGADGGLFIAFENQGRVSVFRPDGSDGSALPAHPDFRALRSNLGIEALAIDAAGVILAVPEFAPRGWMGRGHPVYRFRDGAWDDTLRLRRDTLYLPVGAAFGPDGRFYLLERNLIPGLGIRSRVRRFAVSEGALTDEAVVLETPRGRHENLEGLSVWRDGSGGLMLTMISDDNRDPKTPTTWVEYRVP
jgi:hypothetical protein